MISMHTQGGQCTVHVDLLRMRNIIIVYIRDHVASHLRLPLGYTLYMCQS